MDDPGDHNNLLQDLLYVMRSVDESHAQELFALMRADASIPQLRAFIDRTLSEVQVTTGEEEKIHRLGQVRNRVDVESGIPPFRPKVMDVQYLCDIAPFRVPAHPWTTVTDDDALVSHLVSLYFTWDYPFYAFVDRKAFVHHMVRGNVDSDFCSPFLVNALLANACVGLFPFPFPPHPPIPRRRRA
ncbi:hypothetical protein BDV25DRAFT_37817 [Aspergillus avenaceus]|uniref:Uncharacterized protein n=1 Tax=Aspergillus avenaceus TaxID=36643 RepID=A0A5N6U8Z6_ASPAV|nr:hypothetical protein BDV25DRAFT_37817 [Aspergillus avenaceus]